MGGSSYSRSYSSASSGKSHSDTSQRHYDNVRKVDKSVLPSGDRRISTDVKHPIIISLDVTGSMGENTMIVYDKMPVFWGQLEQKGYLPEGEIAVSFSAVGDAYTDEAPLQVTPFEKGLAIDKWLKKIWLEGNGGGQTMESYDLCALFYLTKASFENMEKGFFFFICDEGPYPELDGKETKEIFQGLSDLFEVYVLHLIYNNGADEKRIIHDWRQIYGERFLLLKDPKAVVDTMLGIIAMRMGISKDAYLSDMKNRGQTGKRMDDVAETINTIPDNLMPVKASDYSGLLPNRDVFRDRRI